MAVHVEDHPLSYFDFEGVIPKGEYGGGDVIVWDWGTFEPEETDDPGKAVASGELKFRLDGEKLKGRFTLVKTRGYQSGQDDWLLIHKKDEDADPDWDVDKLPAVGQDRPHQRRGESRSRRGVGQPRAGREGKHRPFRRAGRPAAGVHRPDEGDVRGQTVRRSRLVLRGQARRLSRRGGRGQRQGPGCGHATSRMPRAISRTWPMPSRRGSTPSRRSSTARSWRSMKRAIPRFLCSRIAPAWAVSAPRGARAGQPQAQARSDLRRAGRLLRVRPALPRRPAARRRATRAAQASAQDRAARPSQRPFRRAHRGRRQGLLRGHGAARPGRHDRQAARPAATRPGADRRHGSRSRSGASRRSSSLVTSRARAPERTSAR